MKKTSAVNNQQLVLREMVLVPGGEWIPPSLGWCFAGIVHGIGYWMDSQMNRELGTGSALLLSPRARGTIRSSQLGEAVCKYFQVAPEKLASLMTIPEQKSLELAARADGNLVRILPPSDPVAQTLKELCARQGQNSFRTRLRLLELFIRVMEPELHCQEPEPGSESGAHGRLEELLRQMPADEMLELSFSELVSRVGCCPRHLGRLFQQTVGMSFREKQSEVRLCRARELLATTESKVVDVAFDSGYQSLSLFNLMFKKRFGLSPTQWRQQQNGKLRRARRPLRIAMA